jgi:transcriptional regulator with XRE-family HTH domain
MPDISELGRYVADKRAAEGLSIRKAADAAGVGFSTISRVEGGAQPDLASFINLCGWLEVDPAEFTGRPAGKTPGIDEAIRHFSTDPRLTPDAASKIAEVVRGMYEALAQPPAPPAIEVHLRAASMLRPGVPERLATILTDMESALRRRNRHGA